MNRTFDDSLILGQIGENTVEEMLVKRGFHVENNASSVMHDGRGPAVETIVGNIPRPDFTVSRRGISIATEIKTKTDRTCGRLTNQVETGIDFKKWNDYKDYTRANGAPVFFFFIEYTVPIANGLLKNPKTREEFENKGRTTVKCCPVALFGQWQDQMSPSLNCPTAIRGQEMLFFSIHQFASFAGAIRLMEAYINKHSTQLI
jgi:hypothetical protein